ncbi:M1 family metallopeptidase [Lactobacillus agrestimuris]|uniref:M1 family metallopeptidase n=1 Tax=Lactobacillus agrestimuris TaxID=2941328 RepID=UPI0020440A03|nr:M1 family metallopeptidase [Lactobacillus agrestimuris]
MIKHKHSLIVAGALLISSTIFLSTQNTSAASDPEIKADNYEMNINLDTKKNLLNEEVTIKVTNNSKSNTNEILVRNIAAGVLKYDREHIKHINRSISTKILKISSNGKTLDYYFGNDESDIFITFPEELKPGESKTVTLTLKTDIPKRKDRFGYQVVNSGKVYNLSFCFPYLSDYRNDKWIYHPYNDEGESRNSAVSNYHVNFQAPKSYKVATTGNSTTTNGKTIADANNVRDFAIVASNKFKVSHTYTNGVKINNYFLPGKDSSKYNKLVKQTAIDSLNLFSKKLGKYPYTELNITEYPFEEDTGGMEYPGLIMIAGNSFMSKKKASALDYSELLEDVSHEVAHQWFYSSVGTDEYTEPWLDEGMSEFLEEYVFDLHKTKAKLTALDILHTKYYPVSKLKQNFYTLINKQIRNKHKSIINYPLNQMPKGEDESSVAYQKAKLFYAELMVAMGEKKFFKALRDYYQTYYLKQTNGKEFLDIIKKYDDSPKVRSIINKSIDQKYLN